MRQYFKLLFYKLPAARRIARDRVLGGAVEWATEAPDD